jgi:acyl-CoA dehydrogenase
MPIYKAPIDTTKFILNDVLDYSKYSHLAGFADLSQDLLDAVLGEAAKLAEHVFHPTNQDGDHSGCVRNNDGSVRTPPSFKSAYQHYNAGGWLGLAVDPAFGGQGLPYTIGCAVGEYFSSSNMSLAMYPGLTQGAIAAILAHGTDAQKDMFVPNMTSGIWSGTMNLTEPHCGTDLGLLRTKAVMQGDGSYKISGQKIFISAGEHDLSENIIHLVLARIDGAPAGVKGISLFIVPKFMPDGSGAFNIKNAVSCGSIESKMGIHGNSTCVMNYDDATGFLLGEEHKGLKAMFTMMNEARLWVGLQGLAISEIAYQNAAHYARERLQGRALSGTKYPEKAADPIVVHPDVRRSLMTLRSFNEAGRMLVLWVALQSDIAHKSEDEHERELALDLLGLLTPVVKGVLTDKGFDHAVMAQQLFGGHGYIEEWGMSQFVRDARITMIYEGANGVQALDLVGRKLGLNGGRAIMAYFKEVADFCEVNRTIEALTPLTKSLKKGLNDLQTASMWFMQNAMAKPDNAGAGSFDFMHLFGLVAFGHMWGLMAKAAHEKLETNFEFYNTKLILAQFFMERIMPETNLRLIRIQAGCESMMNFPEKDF